MPQLNEKDQELYDAHVAGLLEQHPEADGAIVLFDGPEYDPVIAARRQENAERAVDPETGMELPTDAEMEALREALIKGDRIDAGLEPE